MTPGAGRTEIVAARLNWLFDMIAAPIHSADPRAPRWRPYTNLEVGLALPGNDPTVSSRTVRYLRAGGRATTEQLAAIADFFGVGVEYFGDTPVEVDAVRDQVLVRALRDCGVMAYRICRTPFTATRGREQLRNALPTLQLDTRRATQQQTPPTQPAEDHRPPHGTESSTMRTVTQPLSVAQLQKLCHDMVHDLGIAAPFDPLVLCQRLGSHRGRPIEVRGSDLGATTSVGHLVPKRHADHILYDTAAPKAQQALVIYHELVHLIRNHLHQGEFLTCGITLPYDPDSDQQGMYTDWREWEAETGARILSAMSRTRPQPNMLPTRPGSAEHGIAAAFGFTSYHRKNP